VLAAHGVIAQGLIPRRWWRTLTRGDRHTAERITS
jgi:hypothetical protein